LPNSRKEIQLLSFKRAEDWLRQSCERERGMSRRGIHDLATREIERKSLRTQGEGRD
jgi:hypothetical protein